MARSRAPLAITCFLALTACDAEEDLAPEDFVDDLDEEGDQELRVQWGAMAGNFELVQDDSLASKATGSVEVLMRDASGFPQFIGDYYLRGTCGVTFISPHYAVTAAHCVPSEFIQNPAIHTVPVTTYDISAVVPWHLQFASFVDGTFPDYVPLIEGSDVAGYQSTDFDCTVVSRCSHGSHNCAFSADVALLHCPSRPANAPWIPIAPNDPQTGPVELYWFHELLTMPVTQPPAGAPFTEFDRFSHYTVWNQFDLDNNYHYLSGLANTLVPLRSVPWPASKGGAQRKRLGNNATDLFGCHGTSGSGVFQRNAAGNLELLGPTSTGSSWTFTRLCNDPTTFMPGQLGLSYTSNASTRQLQSAWSFALTWDRNPIIWNPPGGGVFDPG